MNVAVHTLNAFTKNGKGGNPAGVVLDADFLNEKQMLDISKKVDFAETAFVFKSNKADFKVRFFTPSREVNLCGHATIATFHLMHDLGILKKKKFTQETKAGILNIEIIDGNIFMNQTRPKYYTILSKKEIAESLNIRTETILDELPIQIVSTGLRDILIPIRNLSDLKKIKPNFKEVAKISKKYDVIGYHLFTFDTKNKATAHCRNLVPLYDVPEEPATGTSNGALSCYLFKHNKITNKEAKNLVYEQGYFMKKPSKILASINVKHNKILEIKVGGKAAKIKKKIIKIP